MAQNQPEKQLRNVELDYLLTLKTEKDTYLVGLFGNGAEIRISKRVDDAYRTAASLLGVPNLEEVAFCTKDAQSKVDILPTFQIDLNGKPTNIGEAVEQAYLLYFDTPTAPRPSTIKEGLLNYLIVPLAYVAGIAGSMAIAANKQPVLGVLAGVASISALGFYIWRSNKGSKNRQAAQAALDKHREELSRMFTQLRVGLLRAGARAGIFEPGYGIN